MLDDIGPALEQIDLSLQQLRADHDVPSGLLRGALVQVLAAYAQQARGFHIHDPAREHMAPKLCVFIDFLREDLSAADPAPR